MDGSTAAVDVAVVREAAATEDVAGNDSRRLCSYDLAWWAISGRGYSSRGPREITVIVIGKDGSIVTDSK
jgi:hypothetical protein